MKKTGLLAALVFLSIYSCAKKESPLFADTSQSGVEDALAINWVNHTYESMTLNEKVGQLFVVAAYSNKGSEHEAEIENLVRDEQIGGLIFMQDIAEHQANLTNRYNKQAKVPLLIGMDAEWGLAQRLKGVEFYPWALTLGAIQDNELIREMGRNIGEQISRMGVHFNFSPDVDVNTNPANPIIGNRSFGSDVDNVSQKGIAYMLGMRDKGVLSSAKHFPGHGDTSQDSHLELPLIAHDKERLKSVELATFRQLINAGVDAVMISHLNVPALDNSGIPATLSKPIITDLLKGEMGFKGLIITDALNMDGVTKGKPVGHVELMAFEAGNDVLLFAQNVKIAKQLIIEKINSGEISEKRLEESVKKILMTKYKVGLNNYKPVDPKNILEDLNNEKYSKIIYKLYSNAATLVKNNGDLLPLKSDNGMKIAYVPLEEAPHEVFYSALRLQTKVDLVTINSESEISKLKDYDYVIVGFHKSSESVYKSYKISESSKSILKAVSEQNKTILTLFGSPYALMDLDLEDTASILIMYQNVDKTLNIAADMLFGKKDIIGVLPVDINDEWKFGNSIQLKY